MAVRTGSLLFQSGYGAFDGGTAVHIGRLGADLCTEDGQLAAQAVMLNLLVASGATDLLVRTFGNVVGRPARSAVGVAALPLGFAVEIEAVLETA